MLLYYVTDRSKFSGDELSRRRQLLETIQQAVRCGVDFIQLREKDLSTTELETLAGDVVNLVIKLRTENPELKTGLLINSRIDVALAGGADGVHLRSDDISPLDARNIWGQYGWPQTGDARTGRATIGVSCHIADEVSRAADKGADFAVLGPIFEKNAAPGMPPAGLTLLRQACRRQIPVFAIGGVTVKNAESCIQAGAAGVAGIRLFQRNEIATVIRDLRNSSRH